MKSGVIVTGLPASGKTTVAREISNRLGFELLDKDDFLEDLYEREGVTSWDHRKRLSRQSDGVFQEAAKRLGSAVLVSHWRPPGRVATSGTPSDWLAAQYNPLVEVCCLCPAEEALRRFLSRTRHPGHFDKHRNPKELEERFGAWTRSFPLRFGQLVEVRTDAEVNFEDLTGQVRKALSSNGSQP